jgi:glycosyl transferase family 25
MALPVFYINVASRLDRREFMEAQFARLALSAERIAAVTPSEISEADRRTYCDPDRATWMTEGEFACNLSHLRAWELMLARGLNHALILEDDAVLSASLPRFLDAIEAEGIDLPLIRLETLHLETRLLPADHQPLPDIALRPAITRDSGACGYIISSAAARYLLGRREMKTTLVDGVLFNPFIEVATALDVHYSDPALCIQLDRYENVASAIGQSDLIHSRAERHLEWSKKPLLKFALKMRSWLDYDLPLALSKLRYGVGSGMEVRTIPFKPD